MERMTVPAEQEIIESQILDFPVEQVHEAWSNPEKLTNWWGPFGFTNEFKIFDFQPGGKWIFDMVLDENTRFPNDYQFVITDKNLIVINSEGWQYEAVFEELNVNKTRLIYKKKFLTVAEREAHFPLALGKFAELMSKLNDVLEER